MATELNDSIRVVNIPGVGHHIRFAAYEPYMAAVREFLEGLGDTPKSVCRPYEDSSGHPALRVLQRIGAREMGALHVA